ncbi:sensor histidine kinase [Streptomyces sp. NPDC001276]|uniref:sensor histidine kinase n=1 Tax=Streptomyces sp. NPDC001276 TaxID=3364555 RepID=UPI0036C6621D
MTEDLLLLARTDRHQGTERGATAVPDPQPVSRRVAARLGHGPPDKTLTVDCATDVAAAISAARLERAVTNLIRNAQQHGHGPTAVTARQEDGQIRIEVRDRGPGFPPDPLPRAFDRFTQSHRARTTTGLGLAIIAAIARAARGNYGAANHPDGGAVVWITLPAIWTYQHLCVAP